MKRMVYPKKRQLLPKELLSCRPNPEAKRLLEMYMPKRKTGTDTVVCNGKLWLIKNTVEDSYTGDRKPVTTMERISRDNKPWWVPLRCVGLAYTTNGTIKFDTRCFQVFDVTKVIPFTIGAVQYDYTINGEARMVIVDGNRCLIHESQLSKYELDDFGRLGVVKACDICGLRYTSASCPNIELHDATRAGYHSIVRLNKAGDARFTIGFEVEKEDEDSPKFLEAYKAGWIAERDGSLSDYIGTEYVSHVLDMMSPDTDRFLKSEVSKKILNAKYSRRCGGHIHISDTERSPSQLFNDCSGYFPLLFALYPKRSDNNYCLAGKASDMRSDDSRRAIARRPSTLEFRIFPSPKNMETQLWRLTLLRYIMLHPEKNPVNVLCRMVDQDTILHSILRKQYPSKEAFLKKVNAVGQCINQIENLMVDNVAFIKNKAGELVLRGRKTKKQLPDVVEGLRVSTIVNEFKSEKQIKIKH